MIACDSICQGKRIFLFALHCILKNLNLHWKRFIRVAQMRVDRLPFEVHYWQFGHQIYISQIYSSELHSIWLRNMTTLLNSFFIEYHILLNLQDISEHFIMWQLATKWCMQSVHIFLYLRQIVHGCTQILLVSIVPSLNNTIDVRTCFVKCHEAGFMDIYAKNQCYIVVT